MKKKNTKDNKINYQKTKNKKKKEVSATTQSSPLKTGKNETIKEAPNNLHETNKALLKPSESYTVLQKSTNNSNLTSQVYNPVSLESSSMNPTKYSSFQCIYCNINFSNKMKLQAHCLTEEHQSIIISDEGRDWKFRPPPRGILASDYSLCSNFSENRGCRFGNQCIQAHTKEELSEWKERFEYRSMKLERAKERELHGASYTDKLLEKLNNSQNFDMLLSESIEGVTFNVNSNQNLSISQKPSDHRWILTIYCPYQIHAIALLYDSHRNHFSLTNVTIINSQKHIHKSIKLKEAQEWVNTEIEPVENVNMEYKIEIYFKTEIYGTLRQAVVVDFGIEPIFIQKFCVDIVPLDQYKNLESARTSVIPHSERWCEENTDIVWFQGVDGVEDDHFNDKLLEMYPPPTDKNIILNQSSLEKYPTKNNYRNRMHDLLNCEELAQFDLISHFNLKSYLHLTTSYLIMPYSVSMATFAFGNELYAKLDLSSEVSEDSPPGRLILNNCNSVLLTKTDHSNPKEVKKDIKRKAYEALIEAKTKKEIYIRLSEKTVIELKLVKDMEVPFDIQFQLNRLPFCEMHYSLDRLSSYDFLFPNVISEPIIPWSPSIQWSESEDIKLNLKQKEALVAISANTCLKLPPILIIGPFGTGKTFTLAQAINQVIQQPNTHILVCTHSNSAADIYIKEYLHPQYEAGLLETKPLRIYYHKRRVATVHSTIHNYCLFEMKNFEHKFCVPTKEQIMAHRIIVTTINTAIGIVQLGIPKGFFSHILIDEAAQVMECATLIPLCLADSLTRIVLAGDYMQLSTEVFSSVCKERNLQKSLLERLYDLYSDDYPCKIMLVENYRSHPAIIKFTSTFFYEGRLKSRGKISAHPRYYPLTFFTARGEDIQDSNSTAYYNNSEVLEICERVVEICKTWPAKLWGPLCEESIGVVSPYLDQVMRIRTELRKKQLYKVSVERVLNVQGKEFRVIILSTVRTTHTCTGNDSSLDYGFLSNAKLLTTAITRAQSLVAVVGDPVSLCSVGKCRKIWEEFLKQCSEAGSLHGISWSSLRSQLDGIEMRKIYGLNPLAQEFIPKYLLFSTVPQPMALLPPTHPLQCFSYTRPFTYSPNIFPTIPITYQSNQTVGFFPNNATCTASVPPSKAGEIHKVPHIGNQYSGIPFQSVANVYPNRAPTIVPFAPSPIAHFSSFAAPNFLPASNTASNIHPAFIQQPSLGVYIPSALPYQPKVGVFPQVVPARVPPGFPHSGNSTNNLVEQERTRPPQSQQQSLSVISSLSHSTARLNQETQSSSPADKSIQFLNNVHFPKEPSTTPNWNENLLVEKERKQKLGIEERTLERPDEPLKPLSESYMGDKFTEEISKLLNEQTSYKQKPNNLSSQSLSSLSSEPKSYKNLASFEQSLYGSSCINEVPKALRPNSSTSLLRQSLPSQQFLTLQQVEKSMHSSISNSKSVDAVESLNLTPSVNSFNGKDQSSLSSGLSSGLSREYGNFLTDYNKPKWNSGTSTSNQQFLGRYLGSSSLGNSCSTPLYLRKGSSNALNSSSQACGSSGMCGNLESSSGWDLETVTMTNSDGRFYTSSEERFGISGRIQKDGRDVTGLYFRKPLDSDSKTYAGVLRSTLDSDSDQI